MYLAPQSQFTIPLDFSFLLFFILFFFFSLYAYLQLMNPASKVSIKKSLQNVIQFFPPFFNWVFLLERLAITKTYNYLLKLKWKTPGHLF